MKNEEIIRRLENIRRTIPHNTKEAIEDDKAISLAIEAIEERESLAKTVNEAAELLRKMERPTCKFRSPRNCDFCAFCSDCEECWKEEDGKT